VSLPSYLVLIILIAIEVLIGGEIARADSPHSGDGGELRLSLGETHKAWLTPSLGITRSDFSYGGTSQDPAHETSSGLELGIRLLSGSNHGQTFLVGLDLRQVIAQIDSRSQFFSLLEDFETRLGVRAEWRPDWRLQPAFGGAWFFGDTIVMHQRDMQFNGNSFAILSSAQVHAVRVFIDIRFGTYQEGPGFIFLPRHPGSQNFDSQSVTIGAELPFEVSMDGLVNGS
jgi:hypothetical protein